MPLFLEMVRAVGEREPDLAIAALAGLNAYQHAPPPALRAPCPVVAAVDGAELRDHGGDGPPVVLVPSLINPPRILDLDDETSLASAIAATGHRTLLVDWGPASRRRKLTVAGHIELLLLPLLDGLEQPPVLLGYCLGGTMAMAAACLAPTAGLITLAAPWDFGAYPDSSRQALRDMWASAEPSARALGLLPIEVLQAAFWSLDAERTVRKFAAFAALDTESAAAHRFVALEEWANAGEAVPFPAAEELIESLFEANATARGFWPVGGKVVTTPEARTLHLTAKQDRIAPAATAPPGPTEAIPSGHVGMVIGSARKQTQARIAAFLALDR